jgi:hypothetical protein
MKKVVLCLGLMAPVSAMAQGNPNVESTDYLTGANQHQPHCKFTRAGCTDQDFESSYSQKSIDDFLFASLPPVKSSAFFHGVAISDPSSQTAPFILLTCGGTPSRVVMPMTCTYSKSVNSEGYQIIESPLELISLIKPIILH